MKKISVSILLSIVLLFIFILIESIILSIIHFNKGMYLKDIYLDLISMLTFFIVGIIFGLIIKKQGLKYSIFFDLAYIIICFIYYLFSKEFKSIYMILIGCKCLLFSLGSVLGVNLKK